MAAFSLALGVTPEILKQRAQTLSDSIDKMCTNYRNLEQIMHDTQAYWIGDAGDRYRQDYDDKQSTIEDLEAQMKEYPDRILKMAGLYEESESSNVQVSSKLGDNLQLV